jgi:gliding motility-associated-like protein
LITNSETVSIADTPVITSVTPTDLSCNGNDTGSLAIVIDTSIGLAPYIINVLNTTTSFDYGNQTTSLAAGNYTITVTDSKNCFVTQTTTIDEPLIITSNIIKTDLICTLTGMQLGTITVDASGGTADYKYRVNNIDFSVNDTYDTSSGTNDHTFTGLDFGDYMVTITDSNNCETIENVTITTGPDVLITTQGATGCTPGSGEMMVEAQASNGTLGLGNFYFAIFPAPAFNALDPAWQPEDVFPALDNTHLFTGLTPGVEYTFVVHDTSTNCEFVQKATVPVSSASNLNANIDNATAITCNGFADGMVEFTISGYDATTVHYEIFASVTNTSTGISGTITGPTGGPETETVNSLSPGEFYILFTETDGPNLGCVNTSPSFVIEQAPTLLIVTANATKNENCNELGTITASGNFGVGPYEYQFLPDTAAAPTAASAAWTNNTVSNVAAGDYIVYILDANSCVQFTPVTVGFDTAPEIDTITVVDFCAINGSYEVEITLTTPDTASYNISVNGGSLTSANFVGGVFTVTGLSQSASLQTLAIQDVNGCGNTENFEISPKFQATALLSNKLLDCSTSPNPEIIISSFDGYGPFAYEITGPVSQALTAIPSPANSVVWDGSTPAVTVTPGSYIVSVYDTGAIGCGPKTFTIEIEPAVVPDFSGIPVNVICNGGLGSISLVQNNNGINPLSYDIAPAAGTFNATTQTYEDLPANTYTITATGTNGCPAVRTITIDEPTAIIITPATIVEFGCTSGNSIDNAKITVPGASGGSDTFTRYRFFRTDDPITVAIEPDTPLQHTSSNSFIESNYNGGYYGIEVFDDAGCSEIINARILPFDELQSASISIIDPISCTSSGEDISFDIIGNVTTYTSDPTNYEIRLLPSTAYEAPGDNTFNNLTAGTYTFGIHNINTGCEFFIEHTVEDPNTYDINVNKLTDAICFGDDGSIEIAFSDTTYTGDYEWEVLNADGSTTVRTDDEGTFTGNGTTAAIPITAGSFIVNVRQAGFPGCTQERTVTITTPPAPIDLNPIVSSSVGCSNNQGTAQIIPTGGVGPYDITLTNNTTLISTTEFGSFGHLFTDLSEGSYDVSITDSNSKPSSCTEIFSNRFSLVRPNYITGIIDPLGLIIACRGDNDGIVRFALDARNTTPDVPTYNHSLNTYDDLAGTTLLRNSALQTSPDFGNQGAGFYSITVTDDLGCSFETPIVEIIEPVEVEALLVTNVPISCLTGTDLLLTASGGTGPYEWSIDNIDANYGPMTGTGGSTHLIPNVSVGTYNFYVRDSFECVAIVSNTVTINPIVPLSVPIISVTPLACFDDNTAIIVADAIGGLGEYEYALFDATTNTEIIANQFSGMFTDLASGTYYVRVQGRGDCEERSIDVLIENPDELVVRETITEISCSGANDGSITLDSVGGTEDFLYAISPNLSQFSPDNTFDELEPGDYTVIAQDTNGCFKLKEFTLRDPDPLLMTLSATPEICAGTANGSITVTPTGGTPPYHTAIDSDNDVDFVEGRVDFDNLKAGDYWIYVKDANKCLTRDLITVETGANLNTTHEVVYECSGDVPTSRINIVFEDESISDVLISLDAITGGDFNTTFENLSPGDHYFYMLHPNGCDRTVNFVVEAFEPLVLTLEQLDLNEITANVTGGKKGYTYYIDDQDNGDDNTFYITRTDTYSVRVVDENGCESTAAIEMEFIDIEIPNFFTPDGDGLNDSWIPRNITQFPDIFIKIYDRYGREIYIIQDSEDGWNGLYQDTDLPTGDYWYVIKLNGEEDEREFVGNFTLYR